MLKGLVYLCQELHRVEPLVLLCHDILLLRSQHTTLQDSLIGCPGRVIYLVDLSTMTALVL